jgi:DNA gyrase/topoisomerase IV subunit B
MKYGNIQKDNFYLEIKHNEEDDFSQCLIINGLYAREGGSPIDYVMSKIVPPIKDKLAKKYSSIKPGDIKNKLKILLIMRFFPNIEFSSQEKIKVTNKPKDLNEFFKDVNWDKIVRQILKDEDIINYITEYFRLKEQAKQNAELKKLAKTSKKRIRSEKYYPAQNKKILGICEGESAFGGLQPSLGRENIGYYVLKGKPLNVYNITPTKFKENKELRELYSIILNENYEKIAIISDNDLDGTQICGLLIAFFYKYLPNYLKEGRVFRFYTPIAAEIGKDKKLKNWVYKFDEIKNLTGNVKYYKGLGSWTPKQLEQVIEKDGFNKMLEPLTYLDEDAKVIDKWFNDKRADDRKDAIINNKFDIIKV